MLTNCSLALVAPLIDYSVRVDRLRYSISLTIVPTRAMFLPSDLLCNDTVREA